MAHPTLHRLLLATGTVSFALDVGNPLVSSAVEGPKGGAVVLDTGICFQIPGAVHAIKAQFAHVLEEAWPSFVMLEHLEPAKEGDETSPIWRVTATSDARRASPRGRPTRLQLSSPLPAKPGQCLGWHTQAGRPANSVAFTDAAAFGQPWSHPDGRDMMSLSAMAEIREVPAVGTPLSFHRLSHRRHALVAELEPAGTSFHRYALNHFLGRPIRPDWRAGAALGDSAASVRASCWAATTPEMCCVPAGLGTPWCFDAMYTYERCCAPEVAGLAGWTPSSSSLPATVLEQIQPNLVEFDGKQDRPAQRQSISMDLFVRTYHAKMQELLHLLHSVAVFWPSDWGVVVVLDGGSAEDEHACALLPKWVRCILQPLPSFLHDLQPAFSHVDPFGHLGGVQRQRGLIWKEWTECWADKFSTAQFIAVCDSDVVLTSFGLPQLMFQPPGLAGASVRPIIWAHADNAQFPNTVAALGLPLQAEFMDGFPLVIKRRHFRTLRHHIIRLFGPESGRNASDTYFDETFVQLLARIGLLSGGSECPSFHTMMGNVLWRHHREQYVWSIRHGHLTGVALQHTCPRLRVAQHVAYWGKENWVTYAGLPEKHLKVGGHPAVLSEVAYAARSSVLILAGLCAVQWLEFNASDFLGFSKGRQNLTFLSSEQDRLQVPDAGLLEVHRDLCSHGLGLAQGRAEIEERLLARSFPGQRWTAAEALHCGSLQPGPLLEEYHRLMRTIHFTIPRSHWRNGLLLHVMLCMCMVLLPQQDCTKVGKQQHASDG